ncbi:MAG: putative sulfate exporter family transporter [Planctomycetaceae bacterium]|nr:putative sulfate exporter family transporter [Planctomycetales bacterium]MCB9941349.1 putative sulfate exporter family transporter [Planctomycetaceae bacterium]
MSDSEASDPLEVEKPQTAGIPLLGSEDWWAIWIGGALLGLCLLAVVLAGVSADGSRSNPLKPWLTKPGSWSSNPLDSLFVEGKPNAIPGLFGVLVVSTVAFGIGAVAMGKKFTSFAVGFCFVFLLAVLAYILAGQNVIKSYNLEYAMWALAMGLLVSNTIGTPDWVKPAARTEFFIKTGLVLLGAEVLFNRLLTLGVPGIFVAWVVTPIVLVTTFWFGQKILRIDSPSLNMVISADMSVCGVSAAIATAAACKAKKEELSLAIGMSLSFTVVMMVLMPVAIKAMGISQVLGGAWMGGTIDATGAVAAAGSMLGEEALQVAATVKMIQNILIGVVAFFVAVFWVVYIEREKDGPKPKVSEIWKRFPKFILGFIVASILFSWLYGAVEGGPALVDAVIDGSTKTLRGWFFCLAFVSIGLETNFKELAKYFKGGKPLILYVVGQSFNLCLTLFMAWLMFEKVFPQAAATLGK